MYHFFMHPVATKRQKDGKTKRQKDKKTKRQKDKRTKGQKDKKTKRQKDKRQKRQKDRRQRPKRQLNIGTSGQFRTLAMFSCTRRDRPKAPDWVKVTRRIGIVPEEPENLVWGPTVSALLEFTL